jgi:hypothetical protein
MERYCLTGQSPQRAVAPMEEEEEGCIHTVVMSKKTQVFFVLILCW